MNATAIKLTVRQWAEEDRPSTKLQNLGVQALSDSELLSILIGSGTTQHNAVEIGCMILSNYGRDLTKLSKADLRELKEVEGVGTYTACKILAAIELGRRRQSAMMGLSPDLCSATAIYNYMLPKMQDLKVEEAHVILMNQNFRLIKSIKLSQGGFSEVSVDIRVLLKEAIVNNATVIAFCHNHPSGNTRPSEVDDKLTQSLKKACDLMRIHFLDHVIVCDGQYYSYSENGRI